MRARGVGPPGGVVRDVRWLWCGVVASVVVVAGCSPEGPPQVITVPPSLTVSPTASMGPAVGLPDKPELWEGTGELGAKAAAVWFLRDLYRYVLETNDTTEWERLSTDDCEFCAGKVDEARKAVADGYVYRQDGDVRASVTYVEELNPLAYGLVLDVSMPTVQVYSSDGVWDSDYTPEPAQMLLVLHREGPDWVMRAGQRFAADEDVLAMIEDAR